VKASIVIPALNEANYIVPTLIAARSQVFAEPYEIIVVDNGSTDGTGDIARRFPDVQVILEERRGLLWAREAGRLAAHGEIIVQLDADSMPPYDWLARGIPYFADPNVVCVSGPYFYYDGRTSFRIAAYAYHMIVMWGIHALLTLFKQGAIGQGGNMFIRRSALEKIGGYNTDITFYGEDVDTARRLSKIGKVIFSRRVPNNSSARRFNDMGVFNLVYIYSMNFFWMYFFKRPYTQ